MNVSLVEMQPIARGIEADKLADRMSEILQRMPPVSGEKVVQALAEEIGVPVDDVVFALGRVHLTYDSDGRVFVD